MKKLTKALAAAVAVLLIIGGAGQVFAASAPDIEFSVRGQLDSFADVYEMVADSVVSINTVSERYVQNGGIFDMFGPFGMFPAEPRQVRGAGSGVIFHETAETVYIVTNFHVVDGAAECYISLDDEIQVRARFVGGDAIADIAVIAVSVEDMEEAGIASFKAAAIGDSDLVRLGDQVLAVGNALGVGKSVTNGIISARDREINVEGSSFTVFQTNAAINRGNSGGPLVNMAGEVIGINVAKFASDTAEGMGFALPSNSLVGTVERIMAAGASIPRPFLGVGNATFIPDEDDIWLDIGLPEAGVHIFSVLPGTLAQYMGIESGDIIIRLNDTETPDANVFRQLINESEIGAEIEIEVVRVTFRSTRFGLVPYGTEKVVLTGIMRNYTADPEF